MAPITLYTTPSCGYCQAAKRLLAVRGFAYTEIDVASDRALRQRVSREQGDYPTVPMIFVGEHFIGGYDQLAMLDGTGALERLVRQPPANDG